MRVGFVGAGRMGRPMVARLVAAGHEVRALGRSAAARDALAGDGAVPVASLAEAAEGAEAVVVCLFSDEQVREVGPGLVAALPEGAILVLHTTGSPRTAEDLAALAAGRGVEVLDVPVSGGPHDIAAGRLTLFAGGSKAALDQVRPALAAYGDPILHVGPLGAGQRVKLVNNALFAAHIGLLADAVRLASALGVPEETLLDALPHASSASRALAGVASRRSVAEFARSTGPFLGKDLAVARALAGDLGADLGALSPAHDVLAALDGVDT
ncbi:3-hydroxyisobutyrate dehydrogenase-like beta-hydroxyacid dehydrogenase [Actinocorallia herbida]|uniref:3-hydroxyisobutyrate dehydrogenase-like beta-hydroxyacid dehydrogenase n=1 Tax=Actinocorallia herbida TaxID=58109 RepID=A0A3N1CUE1_9ACTN|nr:NAD(P)-dependent oxidoreductase [Actinocorallia herbida]ROO84814.1 3-hydroxyisobutyrate dehydrogenase-like beta-hydroxyacid dehydrogenase [Actinocorallia herbida]